MSSMRNAAPRRPHRERAQPQARAKWGLLEKHKDYSLRAKDYNQKKQKLNILSQKSREKHPDEFSFGMIKSTQGKRGARDETENRLSHEAVQLLKTQDAGYLRTVAGRTRRELEKAQEESGLAGVLRRRSGGELNKVVFGEDGEPVRKKRRVSGEVESELSEDESDGAEAEVSLSAELEKSPKTAPKILSRKQQEKEKDRLAQLKADRKRRKRLQELRANKLDVLRKRQKDILAAAGQLELQRAKMAHMVGGVNKNGVKFKVRERKR